MTTTPKHPRRPAAGWLLALVLAILPLASAAAPATVPDLLVISYHDVRDQVDKGDADGYATSTRNFAAHLDWLSGHGYVPVRLDDVVAAQRGERPLPDKAVLLTFDDGLRSHYTRVFPLLRAYGYPAVMAVVTDWVGLPAGRSVDYGPRAFTGDDFLSWQQLREMQASGLIEVASHSHDLHHGVRSNPQGNQTPAAISRIFDPATGRYEGEAAYLARVRADLDASARAIESALGRRPRAIVWPYAAYSGETNRIADQLGMHVSFDLEGRERPVSGLHGLSRLLLGGNPDLADFARELRRDEAHTGLRAIQVDLDRVHDADPRQVERNLDTLIERIRGLGPSHVFLQAFADPDGDGSADALYFPNRHLPVRADLFNRVAWQLRTRAGVKVFAWLPVRGFEPRDRAIVGDIYEDLAVASYFEGLLFRDAMDGRGGLSAPRAATASDGGGQLTALTLELARRAERWRPKLVTVRSLAAWPLVGSGNDAGFAQVLGGSLAAYDYTALVALPGSQEGANADPSLAGLVHRVAEIPGGLEGTLFELPTADPLSRAPVDAERLQARMRAMQAAGARHLGYYPDDFLRDLPAFTPTRAPISARNFPYPGR